MQANTVCCCAGGCHFLEAKSFVGRIFKKFELDMVLWIEPLNFQSREGMTCLRAIVKSEKNAVKVPPLVEVPRG